MTPSEAEQVGVLGYSGATTLRTGQNFMATPYVMFGKLGQAPSEFKERESRISVSYPESETVDAHGLSGSGFWLASECAGVIWTPTVALIGIATHYDSAAQVLVGYRLEKVIEFLGANDSWMQKLNLLFIVPVYIAVSIRLAKRNKRRAAP